MFGVTEQDSNRAPDRPRAPWWPTLALMAVQLAVSAGVILVGPIEAGRYGSDQFNYHEPVVRIFADQLPAPDVSDYASATTPLYHLILAGLKPVIGGERTAFMLAASLFTVALVGLLHRLLATRQTHQRDREQRRRQHERRPLAPAHGLESREDQVIQRCRRRGVVR
ncbi:MAG: hypothetical protein AAGI17_11475, partial [Planctomycetota bacterium]